MHGLERSESGAVWMSRQGGLTRDPHVRVGAVNLLLFVVIVVMAHPWDSYLRR